VGIPISNPSNRCARLYRMKSRMARRQRVCCVAAVQIPRRRRNTLNKNEKRQLLARNRLPANRARPSAALRQFLSKPTRLEGANPLNCITQTSFQPHPWLSARRERAAARSQYGLPQPRCATPQSCRYEHAQRLRQKPVQVRDRLSWGLSPGS